MPAAPAVGKRTLTALAWMGSVLAVCAYAACSSSPQAPSDARIDAPSIDGAPPDADSARVSVHVNSEAADGTPDRRAIAIFMDATGADLHDGPVDANGDAAWDMPTGGTVTILEATTVGTERDELLMTFRGVKPGDHLQAGPAVRPTVKTATAHQMTATMPLDAYSADLYFECGLADAPQPPTGVETLTFYDTCETPTFDLFATQYVSATNSRRFIWQPGVPFVPDGTIAVADDYQPMAKTSNSISNIPPGLTELNVLQYLLLGPGEAELDIAGSAPVTSSETVSLEYPPGAGDGTLFFVDEIVGLDMIEGFAVVTMSPANTDFDLASMPLPTLASAPTTTSTGATWNESFAGAPDARYVNWGASWTDASTGLTHNLQWLFVEDPASGPSTPLVPLPVAFAGDDPSRASSLTVYGSWVIYVDYDNLAGYDDARPFGPALRDITAPFHTIEHRAHFTQSPQ